MRESIAYNAFGKFFSFEKQPHRISYYNMAINLITGKTAFYQPTDISRVPGQFLHHFDFYPSQFVVNMSVRKPGSIFSITYSSVRHYFLILDFPLQWDVYKDFFQSMDLDNGKINYAPVFNDNRDRCFFYDYQIDTPGQEEIQSDFVSHFNKTIKWRDDLWI